MTGRRNAPKLPASDSILTLVGIWWGEYGPAENRHGGNGRRQQRRPGSGGGHGESRHRRGLDDQRSTGGGDSLSVFSAAGPRTRSIMFGTAITQTFPRHPIAVAQQVLTLAQLAPNRFRLGLGTSGQGGVEQTLGINFRAPLAHLREYVRILKALLQEGSVDYSGRYYQAHTSIPAPVDVPVMAAALGEGAFEMCGAEADGAISWVCPGSTCRMLPCRPCSVGPGRPVAPRLLWWPMCRCASTTTAKRPEKPSRNNSGVLPGLPSTETCSQRRVS